jgi:hypothetical protein
MLPIRRSRAASAAAGVHSRIMVVEYDLGRREEAERAVREARLSLDRARSLMTRTRTLLSAARTQRVGRSAPEA